jgi:hypothetical protein
MWGYIKNMVSAYALWHMECCVNEAHMSYMAMIIGAEQYF